MPSAGRYYMLMVEALACKCSIKEWQLPPVFSPPVTKNSHDNTYRVDFNILNKQMVQ